MAKHKKKHKKHGRYGSSMSVSLGSISSALKQAQFGSVALGAGAGMAGAMAADFAAEKALAAIAGKWPNVTIPATVVNLVPAAAAAVVGGLIYAFRKDKQKGARNLAGALAAGIVVSGTKLATQYEVPGFKGLMQVNLGLITDTAKRRAYGLITDTSNGKQYSRYGLITDTRQKAAALNQATRYNAIMEEEIG